MAGRKKVKEKTVEKCIYVRSNGKYRVKVSDGDLGSPYIGTFGTLEEARKARDKAISERDSKTKDKRAKRSDAYIESIKKEQVGKKFGKLTVIDVYKDEKDQEKGLTGFRLLCKCDCGNETRPRMSQVIGPNASTFSCGCDKKERGEKMLDSYLFGGTRVTNLQMKTKNSTGVKGVYLRPNNKYSAIIWFQGKKIHLGTFDKLEDAAQARKEAEDKYFKPVIEEFNKQATYKVEIKDDDKDE